MQLYNWNLKMREEVNRTEKCLGKTLNNWRNRWKVSIHRPNQNLSTHTHIPGYIIGKLLKTNIKNLKRQRQNTHNWENKYTNGQWPERIQRQNSDPQPAATFWDTDPHSAVTSQEVSLLSVNQTCRKSDDNLTTRLEAEQ